MTMLDVSGLRAGYGRIPILQGVDFTVEEGAFTGILGHNGMGKATLIKTIAGQIIPTAGTVHFNGRGLAGVPSHRRDYGSRLCAAGPGDIPDAFRRGEPAHGTDAIAKPAGRRGIFR